MRNSPNVKYPFEQKELLDWANTIPEVPHWLQPRANNSSEYEASMYTGEIKPVAKLDIPLGIRGYKEGRERNLCYFWNTDSDSIYGGNGTLAMPPYENRPRFYYSGSHFLEYIYSAWGLRCRACRKIHSVADRVNESANERGAFFMKSAVLTWHWERRIMNLFMPKMIFSTDITYPGLTDFGQDTHLRVNGDSGGCPLFYFPSFCSECESKLKFVISSRRKTLKDIDPYSELKLVAVIYEFISGRISRLLRDNSLGKYKNDNLTEKRQ